MRSRVRKHSARRRRDCGADGFRLGGSNAASTRTIVLAFHVKSLQDSCQLEQQQGQLIRASNRIRVARNERTRNRATKIESDRRHGPECQNERGLKASAVLR